MALKGLVGCSQINRSKGNLPEETAHSGSRRIPFWLLKERPVSMWTWSCVWLHIKQCFSNLLIHNNPLISSSLLRLFNLGTYLLMEMTTRSYPVLCRVAYKSPLPFLSAFPHPISTDYLYLSTPWSFLFSSNHSLCMEGWRVLVPKAYPLASWFLKPMNFLELESGWIHPIVFFLNLTRTGPFEYPQA